MNARRSLFVMVAVAILLLVSAVYLAVRLQTIVAVTNGLITSHSALDEWLMKVDETSAEPSGLNMLAETIRNSTPEFLGPDDVASASQFGFLDDAIIEGDTIQAAQDLKALLVWELFECHRLQSIYSRLVNITQLVLALIILAMGAVSYFMGRRAQDYRLAPFPEANPNPVFGLNNRGKLIYTNKAVEQSAQQYLGNGQPAINLLPNDYLERLQVMKQEDQRVDRWVHPVREHIFQYRIHALPEMDRIHIYSEDITEQEVIRARNAFIAYHDPVCLLANRQRLEQIVDELNDPDQPLTLVLSFISGMAQVLSTQGVDVADKFARDLSIRLRDAYHSCARANDANPVVFRFDANLFGCLYFAHLDTHQHETLERSLLDVVEQPYHHGKREFLFQIQSGATCEPSTVTSRQLIQRANLALHSLSDNERRYQVFDDGIEAQIQSTSQMEQALRHAIELDELEMVYQPQQDLKTGQLLGFEALMRWHHQGRVVSPGIFIPIAERTGLIHSMDHWGLRDVLRQCQEWEALSNVHPGTLAVNVSSEEFARRNFISEVEAALDDFGIQPATIQLEITESQLFEDEKTAIERMNKLKELGFSLAIDDFGTGYSSFSYLSRFPVDKLKIDRSFVVNMQKGEKDVALIAAMIDVAHQLGLSVIAEGVETDEERSRLQALGCDQIQGYLYGRPMSVSEATLFATRQVEVL